MHYLLLLPLLGIVVFFLGLPLVVSIPIYIFILIISGLMYWVIYCAMKKRPDSGIESLIGTEARVISMNEPGEDALYMIKIRGETWRANSKDSLKPGDRVTISSIAGLIADVKIINEPT